MKKFTKSFLTLALLCMAGWSGAYAQDETDITTLPWVTKGQECTQDFNNADGSTVYGTDAGGTNISYVDVSAYGIIKLYGPTGQRARLFINREEVGNDNGTFYVDINSEGVATFDCNTVLAKQPKAQYIHLNGVKAESWNTHLNLSKITVSGSAITFPEPDPFVLPDGEVEINSLPWVNQGQGCANNLGISTTAPIYGTDAGPSDGNLSYIDATDYSAVKLYGPDGTVRLFINRAEYNSGTFQFYVNISGGVGTLDLAEVYTSQSGATYIHINGVKASSPGAEAQVDHITLVETTVVPVTITNAGYATFCSKKAVALETNMEAYAVEFTGTKALLIPVESAVAANVPVILKAAADDYELGIVESGAEPEKNHLKASDGTIEGDGTIYVLANTDEHGVGFYKLASGEKVPAGKAYLKVANPSREFIAIDGGATAIKSVETEKTNGAIYNLAGQEVKNAQKGIFIINGKKIVVK